MDGLSGTIAKPYKGAKENGWAGFGTGLAKGVAGLVAGPGSGMFGLFAYPFLGMYKSITTSAMTPAEQKIMLARQVYGSFMAREREKSVGREGRSRMVADGWERVGVVEGMSV
jgi:sterol 3beta-glucosyltransferase